MEIHVSLLGFSMKVCSTAGGDLKILEVMTEKNQFFEAVQDEWNSIISIISSCGRPK